jgi:hypothetical protein
MKKYEKLISSGISEPIVVKTESTGFKSHLQNTFYYKNERISSEPHNQENCAKINSYVVAGLMNWDK